MRSPGQGLSPLNMPRADRPHARPRDDGRTTISSRATSSDGDSKARRYRFDRPWGVPVRYHDTERFLAICQPDILEFHLSYNDMERDPAAYLSRHLRSRLRGACAGTVRRAAKLMDLATADEALRRYSLEQTQAVIDITRGLKKFFPKTHAPADRRQCRRLHHGRAAVSGARRRERYRDLRRKPGRARHGRRRADPADHGAVSLAFRRPAPPEHLHLPGRSRRRSAPGMVCGCASTSPTPSSPPTISASISAEGLATLGPHTAHLHLGDAKGLDGEGLQIGEGEIDFDEMGAVLRQHAPERLVHSRDLAGPQEHGRRLLDRAGPAGGPTYDRRRGARWR